MSIVISADKIKKQIKGYDPKRSEEFHSESAHRADKEFGKVVKENKEYKKVILMSGGPASGKTEFISEYLEDEDFIVFDGILPSTEGAKIKIRKILKAKKEPVIYAVWPDDFKRAYVAFLERDRKFPEEHFYAKHASSRETLLWVAKNYSNVKINLYESSFGKKGLVFKEVDFNNKNPKKELIEYLVGNQYTKKEIIDIINR